MNTSTSAHDRVVTMGVQDSFGRSDRPSSENPVSSSSSLLESTEEALRFSCVLTVSALLGSGLPTDDSLSLIVWCAQSRVRIHTGSLSDKFEKLGKSHVSVGHVTTCQTVRRGGVIRNKWV